jgi:type II secretory pathway predicted ATPase ExeA
MRDQEHKAALTEIGKQIKDWFQSRTDARGAAFTVASFLKAYPGLGSERVFRRVMESDLDDLDCERWARDYQAVWTLLQMRGEQEIEDEPIYDDFTMAIDLRKAVGQAMREKGITRLVLCIAPQGCGKTTALQTLVARYGARVALTEATELWKENINEMLRGILLSLGVTASAMPPSGGLRWSLLLEKLSTPQMPRMCLVIDEAHHLGPRSLNMVKSIVNHLPGEVVLGAKDTLWKRLETAAYEEAKQLTQNRLLERISVDSAPQADIAHMLARRLGMAPGTADTAARGLARECGKFGNFTYVNLVCRRARKLAGKGEATAEIVAEAAAHVARMR